MNHDESSMDKYSAACGHSRVKYDQVSGGNGTCWDRWFCPECNTDFIPLPYHQCRLKEHIAASRLEELTSMRNAVCHMCSTGVETWEENATLYHVIDGVGYICHAEPIRDRIEELGGHATVTPEQQSSSAKPSDTTPTKKTVIVGG